MQYIRPPFVVRLYPPEPWLLPVNRTLYYWAQCRWAKAREKWPSLEKCAGDGQDQSLQKVCGEYCVRRLHLVHPRALALARNDPRFTIRRHSIFERTGSPCDVIRTMNILNRSYFREEQLAAAARNIVASLKPGGIWVVGRTVSDTPPVHNVSIFRKRSSGSLESVERLGAGSEIDSICSGVQVITG